MARLPIAPLGLRSRPPREPARPRPFVAATTTTIIRAPCPPPTTPPGAIPPTPGTPPPTTSSWRSSAPSRHPGRPPTNSRAASARLNTLKRANKLPRYTPSRKSARRHPPGDTGRATPGPARPRGLDDAPRASKRPGKGPTMTCPSCLQTVKASHPDQFRQHVARCCPDAVAAVPPDAWHDVASAAAAVAGHEAALSDAARTFAFRGERRMSDAEVAEVLGGGVTPARVRGMLRRASRAIRSWRMSSLSTSSTRTTSSSW